MLSADTMRNVLKPFIYPTVASENLFQYDERWHQQNTEHEVGPIQLAEKTRRGLKIWLFSFPFQSVEVAWMFKLWDSKPPDRHPFSLITKGILV